MFNCTANADMLTYSNFHTFYNVRSKLQNLSDSPPLQIMAWLTVKRYKPLNRCS